MSREGNRVIGFIAAAVALGLIVAVMVDSIFRKGGGAEGAIVTRLKVLEGDGLTVALDAGLLVSQKPSYQRISVALDADGQGAEVTSTVDFTGPLQRPPPLPPTSVSSLGLERARYVNESGDWKPARGDAPRLLAIVHALEGRRRALERGDPALEDGGIAFPEVVRDRSYRSEAWFIRSEREDVEVAEDFTLIGTALDRPVNERSTKRLTLQEADGGLFSFPDGIL